MQTRSAAAARTAGEKHYWTGKPCPYGHVARRFASNYGCEECLRIQERQKPKDSKKSTARRSRYRFLRQTPRWADLQKIEQFYRKCPIGLEVDHIVPIRGQNVCGLHVENNLQYLTRTENLRKFNKWVP